MQNTAVKSLSCTPDNKEKGGIFIYFYCIKDHVYDGNSISAKAMKYIQKYKYRQ